MNKWIGMGRLVRDPEVRYSPDRSMTIAKYTLAIDRRGRNDGEQTADFINCVAFAKSGEFAEKYFRQGMRVLVTGRIQTGSYVNKDGNKVRTTDIVVEEQEFCESKSQNQQQSNATFPSQNSTFPSIGDGFMSVPDNIGEEGLPF